MNIKEEPSFDSIDHLENNTFNSSMRIKMEPYIKQETDFRTNLRETNSTNNINLLHRNGTIASTAPHTYIPNNNIISNPGQTEYLLYTVDRNSSDESPQIEYQPIPLQSTIMNMKQEPSFNSTDHIEDQTFYSSIHMKEEPYFQATVREHFPHKANIEQSNELRQQSSVSIAPHNSIANNNSPVLNIKQETNSLEKNLANSNESIVSTASQNSMATNFRLLIIKQEKNLDTNVRERNSSDHMDSVEQAIQFNPINTASNVLDPIESRNMEPQVFKNLRNRKVELSLLNDSHSDTIRLNSANKIQYQYDCNIPEKVHQTLHSKSQAFSCKYCDKTFSGKGPCTNHEKSHNKSIKQNKKNKLSSIKTTNFCNFCDRKFTRRCYFTNHMMRKHNINPNSPKPTSIDYNESIILSENIELTNEYKNKQSVPENNKNKNLDNPVNKSNEKKSTFCIYNDSEIIHSPVDGNSIGTNLMDIEHSWFPCDVCEKKLSTPNELNVHRKSHSGIVPYMCKICNRTYQLKCQWNRHLKCHYKKPNSN